MNPNRQWIALAYTVFAFFLWVLTAKFSATVMGWVGLEEYDYEILGAGFTLTSLIGLVVAALASLYAWRHPTLSTLSSEVVGEIKKVTWPNAQETKGATIVVIITVFIMAIFLGVFDLIWSNVMDFLYPS